MCQELLDKVTDFCSQNLMFTSVDISNSIKKDGKWISNSEVAGFLRRHLLAQHNDYAKTTISVAGGAQATLYHPIGANIDEYTDRNQHALTPVEVGIDMSSKIKFTATPQTNLTSLVHLCPDSNGFYRIPASLVTQLGLTAGYSLDKDLILGAKNVTRDFKVHKDGRLKIHYGYVGFGSFVDVSVENGKLKFA